MEVCSRSFRKKIRLLGCKPASTSIEANVDLWFDDSHTRDDPRRYRRLIEKLIYHTIIRLDIIFAVGVLSRFMHHPRVVRWTTALRTLVYIKSSPEKCLLYWKHGHMRISRYFNSVYTRDKGIGSLLLNILNIVLLLEKILWLGGVRNKMWHLNLM